MITVGLGITNTMLYPQGDLDRLCCTACYTIVAVLLLGNSALPPRWCRPIPPGAAVNPAFKLSSPPGEGWDVFSARHHLPFSAACLHATTRHLAVCMRE